MVTGLVINFSPVLDYGIINIATKKELEALNYLDFRLLGKMLAYKYERIAAKVFDIQTG